MRTKKQPKIKQYRLSISECFPKTHKRKGEKTFFIEKIKLTLNHAFDQIDPDFAISSHPKRHTIRSNYSFWEKRLQEVQAGRAIIELFHWGGKPYGKGVKQVVFAVLDKDSGCGIQKLTFSEKVMTPYPALKTKDGRVFVPDISDVPTLAKNDGLSLDDFKEWFKSYKLDEPMAIIHFTKFRY